MNQIKIGEFLKELRKEKGLTQEQLAEQFNVSRKSVSRWETGRGYPDGLKGDQIPIEALLVSIADVYDALTTKRVYKDAFEMDKAFNMVLDGECGEFSPKLLNCFCEVKGQFEDLARKFKEAEVEVYTKGR